MDANEYSNVRIFECSNIRISHEYSNATSGFAEDTNIVSIPTLVQKEICPLNININMIVKLPE